VPPSILSKPKSQSSSPASSEKGVSQNAQKVSASTVNLNDWFDLY